MQYTIEALFAVRKGGFADYPAIPEELDLVEVEDQVCIVPPPHFNMTYFTVTTQILCERQARFLSVDCVGDQF